jgi:hypothetical protein
MEQFLERFPDVKEVIFDAAIINSEIDSRRRSQENQAR